jgi:hypothetical protein
VTPIGPLNCAVAPLPSLSPAKPSPAKVETTPWGVTLRIALLPVSATYRLPAASIARPDGVLNAAALPAPSA